MVGRDYRHTRTLAAQDRHVVGTITAASARPVEKRTCAYMPGIGAPRGLGT
jgi:hypothetical protein